MEKLVVVEGWRNTPHSHAIVSQFQCLEFLNRPDLKLFHRELPLLFPDSWKHMAGLFDPSSEQLLAAIPPPPHGMKSDITIRMNGAFEPRVEGKLFAFHVTEFGFGPSLVSHEKSAATIVTPSEWSRQGLVRRGACPDRVCVIPHGVDPQIFKPLPPSERAELRRQLGWTGFVFLNIGAITPNKGIGLLVKAFAAICERFPEARLFLKGLDSLYASTKNLTIAVERELSPRQIDQVKPHIGFTSTTLNFLDVAKLYQAADAYVSPYFGEGFNLPVLEALACGTPVICTDGGPTDEFTIPDISLKIESQKADTKNDRGEPGIIINPNLNSLVAQMLRVLQDNDFISKARRLAPEFVRSRYTWKHVVDRWLDLF